jgi:hypothetical protein
MQTAKHERALTRHMPRALPRALALCAALWLSAPADAAAPDPGQLAARVEQLAAEVAELRAQLASLRGAQPVAQAATPAASATISAPPAAAQPVASGPDWFGYGELNYTKPRDGIATADLARFVLGTSVRFDERTRLVSELEIEHTVSSASDAGEVEVEQAYIERSYGEHLYARAGLVLVPLGLLNENHEPTRYYGVQRNGVETAIIPTTWREGALALQARTDNGWRWDVGLGTGFDLSRWDAGSSEGRESPLRSIHQELSLARAADLSGFVAFNYTGVPGLRVGGGAFAGGVSQSQPGLGSARVALWEAHAAWSVGGWDLAGLYASGHLSGTRALNASLLGFPTPVPEDFRGGYLQAAWRGLPLADGRLVPFLRHERYNTGAHYASLAPAPTPAALPWTIGWIGGLNYAAGRGLVLKADYANYSSGETPDRFDLGLGYEF